VYERAVRLGRPVIVDDLAALGSPTGIEDQMVASGLRTFVCAPLHYQEPVIGTIELGSPRPDDLDASHLPKLHEVLPLFAMAVQRSMEELNARVQTQIKERFTAIHPVGYGGGLPPRSARGWSGGSARRCWTGWSAPVIRRRRSWSRSSSSRSIRSTQ